MPKFAAIRNLSRTTAPLTVLCCTSFLSQLRGLTFRRELPPDQGILLIHGQAGRFNSAVHTCFMGFEIAVIWVSDDHVVVERRLAAPWRPLLMSPRPARLVLEVAASRLADFNPGERLELDYLM